MHDGATLWVGGQATSQGVCAFDDNKWIDTTGGTASYLDLSRRIRTYYAMTGKCRHCGAFISPLGAPPSPPAPVPRRAVKAPGPPPKPPAPPMPPAPPVWDFGPESAQEMELDLGVEQADPELENVQDEAPQALEFSDQAPPADEDFAEPVAKAPIQHLSIEPEEEQTCGICHSTISADEATETCPSCKLVFHADCWHENRGCAAYGCNQVNVLETRPVS